MSKQRCPEEVTMGTPLERPAVYYETQKQLDDLQNLLKEFDKEYRFTTSSFSPYIRKKRKNSFNSTESEDEDHTTQVPMHTDPILPTTLPPWTPPQPTPPPKEPSHPNQHPPATSPLLPTPPATQKIPSLMNIKFTPHTIRQIKTRLHQRNTPSYHHKQQIPPLLPHFIPLLHTTALLLNSLLHIAATLPTYIGLNTRT